MTDKPTTLGDLINWDRSKRDYVEPSAEEREQRRRERAKNERNEAIIAQVFPHEKHEDPKHVRLEEARQKGTDHLSAELLALVRESELEKQQQIDPEQATQDFLEFMEGDPSGEEAQQWLFANAPRFSIYPEEWLLKMAIALQQAAALDQPPKFLDGIRDMVDSYNRLSPEEAAKLKSITNAAKTVTNHAAKATSIRDFITRLTEPTPVPPSKPPKKGFMG